MRQTTILIVDDNMLWLHNLREYLTEAIPEADVVCAYNVRKALDIIRRHPPDVAIVDLHMPAHESADMESDAGYDVVHCIKKETPSTQVIVCTGYSSEEMAVRCMRAGAFDFISKPVMSERILDVIKRAIELGPSSLDRDSLTERLILTDWDDLRRVTDPQKKGSSLESLCSLLFTTVPGWQQIEGRVRTKTEEIDLVIINESSEEFWKRFSAMVLVECKNWTKKRRPGRKEFDAFYSKLQRRAGEGCRLGFFVSFTGVASTFESELQRILKENTVIVTLGEDDLWGMICAENRSRFLKERVAARMLT